MTTGWGQFVDEEEEDDAMGPTWQMEDIQSGSLFTRTYQTAAASTLPTATLRTAVEYGNKSRRRVVET